MSVTYNTQSFPGVKTTRGTVLRTLSKMQFNCISPEVGKLHNHVSCSRISQLSAPDASRTTEHLSQHFFLIVIPHECTVSRSDEIKLQAPLMHPTSCPKTNCIVAGLALIIRKIISAHDRDVKSTSIHCSPQLGKVFYSSLLHPQNGSILIESLKINAESDLIGRPITSIF